jgi:uncharacterized protein (TIGR03435 family)
VRDKPAEPRLYGGRSKGPSLIAGHGITLSDLAEDLSDVLGKPVVDSTGLSGKFEIRLTWRPDDPEVAAASACAGLDTESLPSLFTAINEQLGFRLKSTHLPAKVVVVDSISQMPTEN